MENISVLTSQNVAIEYEIASVGDRYIASLIDYFIMTAYVIGIILLFNAFDQTYLLWSAKVYIPLMLPLTFYHLLSELLLEGQSIGKKVRKLKVVNLDGSAVSIGAYLLRWFLGIIESTASMGGVAVLAIILSGRGQRIGDMAAGTTVVNLRHHLDMEDVLAWQTTSNYQVKYPEAAQLTDNDIALIKEVLLESERADLQYPLYQLQDKLQKKLQIEQKSSSASAFLHTIIFDYNHIYG